MPIADLSRFMFLASKALALVFVDTLSPLAREVWPDEAFVSIIQWIKSNAPIRLYYLSVTKLVAAC